MPQRTQQETLTCCNIILWILAVSSAQRAKLQRRHITNKAAMLQVAHGDGPRTRQVHCKSQMQLCANAKLRSHCRTRVARMLNVESSEDSEREHEEEEEFYKLPSTALNIEDEIGVSSVTDNAKTLYRQTLLSTGTGTVLFRHPSFSSSICSL